MSQAAFRFLHASGLRLGIPLHGFDEVPEHLQELCIDAPLKAARAVFDTAVAERVDFVVFSGDVLDPRRGGPRAVAFLYDQFSRLQEKKIEVYWCGGAHDHFASWPAAVSLPANVHVFPADRVTSWVHRRGDHAVATIQGRSSGAVGDIRPQEYAGDSARFTVAVAYGNWPQPSQPTATVDYWALGGCPNASTVSATPTVVQYAGSPQGRNPAETGVHGAVLVEVEDRVVQRRELIATDALRWHADRIELPDEMNSSGLRRLLYDRSEQLVDKHPDRCVLTHWTLVDGDQLSDTRSDQLAAQLRQGGLAADLVTYLRTEFGTRHPGIWTLAVEAETPVVFPPGWYEEDTVLGDLLRSVKQYQQDTSLAIELERFESDDRLAPELVAALRIEEGHDRTTVLQRVAALGVDLLRGDRVLSEELATLVDWADTGNES